MSKPDRIMDRDLIALAYKAAGLISCAPDAAEKRQDVRLCKTGLCEPVTCRDGTPHPEMTRVSPTGRALVYTQIARLRIMQATGVWRFRQGRPMTARQAAGQTGGEVGNG